MQTATKIEAIYDTDHGPNFEGWYARVYDGRQERDIPFDARRMTGDERITRLARRAVREEFVIPRGCQVEVIR